MSMRKSRNPVVPLNQKDLSVIGELIVDRSSSVTKLLIKLKDGSYVDLIEEYLNIRFDKLDKDFREQHVSIVMQETEPTGSQQLWLQTKEFGSAVTDNYQL